MSGQQGFEGSIAGILDGSEGAASSFDELRSRIYDNYKETVHIRRTEKGAEDWLARGGVPLKESERDILGRSPESLRKRDLAYRISWDDVRNADGDPLREAEYMRQEEDFDEPEVGASLYVLNLLEPYR